MDQNNNGSWLHKFISLDEMKSSSLVISFLVFSGIAIYMLITKGEIPQNLTTLLTIQIGVIGGVNCVNYVSSNMSMSKTNQPMTTQQMMPYNNTYGTNYNPMSPMQSNMGVPIQPTMNQQMVQPVQPTTTQTKPTKV